MNIPFITWPDTNFRNRKNIHFYTSETDKILGINSTDILTYSNSFETIVMLIET